LARDKIRIHGHARIVGSKISWIRHVLSNFSFVDLVLSKRKYVHGKNHALCFLIVRDHGNSDFLEIGSKYEKKNKWIH